MPLPEIAFFQCNSFSGDPTLVVSRCPPGGGGDPQFLAADVGICVGGTMGIDSCPCTVVSDCNPGDRDIDPDTEKPTIIFT